MSDLSRRSLLQGGAAAVLAALGGGVLLRRDATDGAGPDALSSPSPSPSPAPSAPPPPSPRASDPTVSAPAPTAEATPDPEPEPVASAEPPPEPSAEPEAEPPPEPAVAATAIVVICRDAWGARPPAGEFRQHTIQRLTVHHSAVALADNRRAPAQIRGHQAFHQRQGWPDIAYHFGVDRRGNAYELRPYAAAGDTFTDYDPAGHFLVLAEGNFNEEHPSDDQLEGVARLLAWGAREFGAALDTVGGHRDHASTSCPGDNLYRFVADGSIVRRAAALGGVAMEPLCGPAGAERVAAIERGEA